MGDTRQENFMKKTAMLLVLALLFTGAAVARDAPSTEVEVLAHATRSWDGSLLPAYPEGQPEVRILRIRIPAGTRLPMHRHPVINAGVLVAGELTFVTEDGGRLELQAGDAIVEVVDRLHYGVNEGDATAEIIVFYAGVEGAPITVHEPDSAR